MPGVYVMLCSGQYGIQDFVYSLGNRSKGRQPVPFYIITLGPSTGVNGLWICWGGDADMEVKAREKTFYFLTNVKETKS